MTQYKGLMQFREFRIAFRRALENISQMSDSSDYLVMQMLVEAELQGVNTRASYQPCDPDWIEG